MRTVLILCCLLGGCAEVEQILTRTPSGGVAWRIRVAPDDPAVGPPADWVEQVRRVSADRARGWTERTAGRTWYVVQAQSPDLAGWAPLRAALIGGARALSDHVPSTFLPPERAPRADAPHVVHHHTHGGAPSPLRGLLSAGFAALAVAVMAWVGRRSSAAPDQSGSRTARRRRLLRTTLTEDSPMAAPANMGESDSPHAANTPAASGMPTTL